MALVTPKSSEDDSEDAQSEASCQSADSEAWFLADESDCIESFKHYCWRDDLRKAAAQTVEAPRSPNKIYFPYREPSPNREPDREPFPNLDQRVAAAPGPAPAAAEPSAEPDQGVAAAPGLAPAAAAPAAPASPAAAVLEDVEPWLFPWGDRDPAVFGLFFHPGVTD